MFLLQFAIVTYLTVAAQMSLQPLLAYDGFSPNLLWLVLLWSCRQPSRAGAVFSGALVGLLVDSLTPGRLGIGMFCSAMTAYLCHPAWERDEHFPLFRYLIQAYWPLLGLEIVTRLVRRAVTGRVVLDGQELVAAVMSALVTFVFGAALILLCRLSVSILHRGRAMTVSGIHGRV